MNDKPVCIFETVSRISKSPPRSIETGNLRPRTFIPKKILIFSHSCISIAKRGIEFRFPSPTINLDKHSDSYIGKSIWISDSRASALDTWVRISKHRTSPTNLLEVFPIVLSGFQSERYLGKSRESEKIQAKVYQ